VTIEDELNDDLAEERQRESEKTMSHTTTLENGVSITYGDLAEDVRFLFPNDVVICFSNWAKLMPSPHAVDGPEPSPLDQAYPGMDQSVADTMCKHAYGMGYRARGDELDQVGRQLTEVCREILRVEDETKDPEQRYLGIRAFFPLIRSTLKYDQDVRKIDQDFTNDMDPAMVADAQASSVTDDNTGMAAASGPIGQMHLQGPAPEIDPIHPKVLADNVTTLILARAIAWISDVVLEIAPPAAESALRGTLGELKGLLTDLESDPATVQAVEENRQA
jgi:hypothetical protein